MFLKIVDHVQTGLDIKIPVEGYRLVAESSCEYILVKEPLTFLIKVHIGI